MERDLREAKELVGKLASKGASSDLELKSLFDKRVRLEQEHEAVLKEFEKTGQQIRDAHLPKEILDRHAKALSQYKERYRVFNDLLTGIEEDHKAIEQEEQMGEADRAKAKRQELAKKLFETKTYLEAHVKERPHQKLDPNNLPHRMPKYKERKPRLNKKEFAEFNKPVQLAYNGDDLGLLGQAMPVAQCPVFLIYRQN
jgi:hypothetical protein